MNIFTNTILIFVFILILLIFNIINFDQNDNLLKNKLYLFIAVFIFQILLKSIHKLKNNNTKPDKKINLKDIFKNSVLVSLFSIIGLSIYSDIINTECIKTYISSYINIENTYTQSIFISLIISIFINICILFNIIINGNN
jgi:hypothetical protein